MNQIHSNSISAIGHKVPIEYLFDFASGASPEPVALAIATMIDMNPADAAVYAQLNQLGGAMLEALPATADDDGARTRMMARVNTTPQLASRTAATPNHQSAVPWPLHAYVGDTLDGVRWRRVASGVEEYVLKPQVRGYRASLLRIAPGKAMPTHRHGGLEMTVVLEGAYCDSKGTFSRGDMEIANVGVEHKPIADMVSGCICLAVLSAPLRFNGLLGWLINPFLRV
jgi:putative transcriptional regulator